MIPKKFKFQFSWSKTKVILKNTAYGLAIATLVGTTVGVVYVGRYVNKNILSVKAINKTELTQNPNSEIFADDGKTLIWTDADYLHFESTKENTPQKLVDILLATEDQTFYNNKGYSEQAIVLSVLTSIKDKLLKTNDARGGSTITQQLIKNIRYLDQDISNYDRKVQEIVLAKNLTSKFSKDDILYAYLNKVGFLENSYGFNSAMYLLYGEEIAKDKTDPTYLAKYATIVGMLKNPSLYNPRTNPEKTQARRNQVLANALEQGAITKKEYKQAKKVPITQDLKDQGWFTQQIYNTASSNGAYVNSILKQLKEYGYDIKNKNHPIKVVSNLNIEQNEWLQAEVAKPEHYANERQQVAITVTEPNTGKVLAQVGSRNGGSPYDLNRATQVTRSSGSTIKPFLSYAPLIEFSDVTEDTIWNANTTTYAGTNITVHNYGNAMYGNQTTSVALKWSLNVPAVDALTRQQPWMNQTIMTNLGLSDHEVNSEGNIDTVNTFAGSQALGIHDSTANFAKAFATLASNGKTVNNMYVKSVTQDGQTINLDNKAHQSMSPRTASKLSKMLETTLHADGSAKTAAIPEFAGYAVKTGTVGFDDNAQFFYDKEHTQLAGAAWQVTNEAIASDQWMSGYTKSVAVSVWTGFDDQAIYGDWLTPENQTRATLLVNVMRHFNQNKDTSQFNFDQSRTDIAKKEPIKNIHVVGEQKAEVLTQKNMVLPNISVNTINATPKQREIAKGFEANTLIGDFDNITPYFKTDDPRGFGLYKAGKSKSTKFYKINTNGALEDTGLE